MFLKKLKFVFIVFVLATLNYCASQTVSVSDDASDAISDQSQIDIQQGNEYRLSPALAMLVELANNQVMVENYAGAAASLERALRL